MRQYEVWLADLDPSFGTEAGKTRPVVIIQSDLFNGKHSSTIVCPITSKVKPKMSVIAIHLKKGDAGLNVDSDIMVDQIRAINNKRFIKKIGALSANHQQDLIKNLKIVLDIT